MFGILEWSVTSPHFIWYVWLTTYTQPNISSVYTHTGIYQYTQNYIYMYETTTHTHIWRRGPLKKYECCEVSHTLYHHALDNSMGRLEHFQEKKILELCIVAFNVSLGCINIKYWTLYALGDTHAYIPIDLEIVSTKFIT